MKKTVILVLALGLLPFLAKAQTQKEDNWVYTNSNLLNLYLNSKISLENGIAHQRSWGTGVVSYHGFIAWQHLEMALGLGLNFNFGFEEQAIPLNFRLAYHYYEADTETPYLAIDLGTNLALGSFEHGGTFKLIGGYAFYPNDYVDFQLLIEVYRQMKTYGASVNDRDFEGYGVGFGIKF